MVYSTLTTRYSDQVMHRGATAPASLTSSKRVDQTDSGSWDKSSDTGSAEGLEVVSEESSSDEDEEEDEVEAMERARFHCSSCQDLRDLAQPRQLPKEVQDGEH